MLTREELRQKQALPLDFKIAITYNRIANWLVRQGGYISFSGGKDSTVLVDITQKLVKKHDFLEMPPLVFADTGLEYPEVREFVKSFGGVEIVRPTHGNRPISFRWVIQNYGYPIISKEVSEKIHKARLGQADALSMLNGTKKKKDGSKSNFNIEKWKPLLNAPFKISHMCCDKMKKNPLDKYSNLVNLSPITAEMAEESRLRTQQYLKNSCNGFDMKSPKSTPMAFWTEQDILQYIKDNNLPIASVYGDIVYASEPEQIRIADYTGDSVVPDSEKLCTTGCDRTGCVFCAFGAHLERGEGRFLRLAQTHPQLYEYCIGGGEWNGKLWQPSKKGLGMGYVFDYVNDIYGKDFIKY